MAELKNRDQLESQIGNRLHRLSVSHRNELEQLLGHPPNPDNVPTTFWEKIQKEFENEAAAALLIVFMASAQRHGSSKNMAFAAASPWVAGQAKRTAASYRTSATEQVLLMRNPAKTVTKTEVRSSLNKVFGKTTSLFKSTSIVTNAQSTASEFAVGTSGTGLSEDDTWFTRNDNRVCPICDPLHGTPRSVWGTEFPSGPPAHPNCRCWIRYANES